VDEDATEVVGVLFDPVIERLDVLAIQEAQHPLLELSGALSRDDLDQGAFFSMASSMMPLRARSISSPRL
jgi:hypothetical protein